MGIGYIVLASCPGTSFCLRFQACLTVYSHWASQVAFSQRSQNVTNICWKCCKLYQITNRLVTPHL